MVHLAQYVGAVEAPSPDLRPGNACPCSPGTWAARRDGTTYDAQRPGSAAGRQAAAQAQIRGCAHARRRAHAPAMHGMHGRPACRAHRACWGRARAGRALLRSAAVATRRAVHRVRADRLAAAGRRSVRPLWAPPARAPRGRPGTRRVGRRGAHAGAGAAVCVSGRRATCGSPSAGRRRAAAQRVQRCAACGAAPLGRARAVAGRHVLRRAGPGGAPGGPPRGRRERACGGQHAARARARLAAARRRSAAGGAAAARAGRGARARVRAPARRLPDARAASAGRPGARPLLLPGCRAVVACKGPGWGRVCGPHRTRVCLQRNQVAQGCGARSRRDIAFVGHGRGR